MRLPSTLTLVEPSTGCAATFVTVGVAAELGRTEAASGATARAAATQNAAFDLRVIRMGGTSGAVKGRYRVQHPAHLM
jgi:hypothetical protein